MKGILQFYDGSMTAADVGKMNVAMTAHPVPDYTMTTREQ
jgi:hypothetical protein